MTTEELKDWIDERINLMEKNLKELRAEDKTDFAILCTDVKSHDRWIHSIKGMWAMIIIAFGWLLKIHLWK
jgi:hypothetical protein